MGRVVDDVIDQADEAIDKIIPRCTLVIEAALQDCTIDGSSPRAGPFELQYRYYRMPYAFILADFRPHPKRFWRRFRGSEVKNSPVTPQRGKFLLFCLEFRRGRSVDRRGSFIDVSSADAQTSGCFWSVGPKAVKTRKNWKRCVGSCTK